MSAAEDTEEDASTLKLGRDFNDSRTRRPLWNAEVKVILESLISQNKIDKDRYCTFHSYTVQVAPIEITWFFPLSFASGV